MPTYHEESATSLTPMLVVADAYEFFTALDGLEHEINQHLYKGRHPFTFAWDRDILLEELTECVSYRREAECALAYLRENEILEKVSDLISLTNEEEKVFEKLDMVGLKLRDKIQSIGWYNKDDFSFLIYKFTRGTSTIVFEVDPYHDPADRDIEDCFTLTPYPNWKKEELEMNAVKEQNPVIQNTASDRIDIAISVLMAYRVLDTPGAYLQPPQIVSFVDYLSAAGEYFSIYGNTSERNITRHGNAELRRLLMKLYEGKTTEETNRLVIPGGVYYGRFKTERVLPDVYAWVSLIEKSIMKMNELEYNNFITILNNIKQKHNRKEV